MRWRWCPLYIKPTLKLDFYKSKSLKRQPKGRHITLLGHIIPIPKTTSHCSYFRTLCASIPIEVFGFTLSKILLMIYWGKHANHCTTRVIFQNEVSSLTSDFNIKIDICPRTHLSTINKIQCTDTELRVGQHCPCNQ